jgi:hypothetical protein
MSEKSIFLYVTGDDYAALYFEEKHDPQKVYESMLLVDTKHIILPDEDTYIEVRIKEFEKVNSDFLDFIQSEFADYDDLKHANIYEVETIKNEE